MLHELNTKVGDTKEKWSPLVKLKMDNLNNCIELQNKMAQRMKNKTHTFNYISKRTKSDFEKIIKNNELFGVFDKNNILSGIVSIKYEETSVLLSNLKYENDSFSISNELLDFLSTKNGCYLSSWMSDLEPKNVGIGKYMVDESMKYIKKNLHSDFAIAGMELNNSLSYKLFSKSNLSFACSHKIINFKNVNGFLVKIPAFFIISFLNKKIAREFYNSLIMDSIKPFKYTKIMIRNIFLSNKTHDPILEKNELIVVFKRKLVKIKYNPRKLDN